MGDKVAKKRIGEVLEQSREMVVGQKPENAETFMQLWVSVAVDMLVQAGGKPHESLPPANAHRLFLALVTEGGLPRKLKKQAGIAKRNLATTGADPLKSLMAAVSIAIDTCYAEYQLPKKTSKNTILDWSRPNPIMQWALAANAGPS